MPTRNLTAHLTLLAALLATGCEDTPLTAPSDGTIVVYANPGNVMIDPQGGVDSAQSAIIAQVLSAENEAASGVEVMFVTTGGVLGSSDNSCDNEICKITGDTCSGNADCPAVAPPTTKTDGGGFAYDTLTLVADDPSEVEVSAISGALVGTVKVGKTMAALPTAILTATPESKQEKGQPVSFSGGDSTSSGGITCYQFSIEPESGGDQVFQGPSTLTITETYTEAQFLSVVLRVSDQAEATTWCPAYEGTSSDSRYAPESRFSPNIASLTYEIVCDLTLPVVDAGNDVEQTLEAGEAKVSLSGTASDPSSGITSREWTCKDGGTVISGADVDCSYTEVGIYTATFTATNGCGDSASDSLKVTIK